MMLIMLFLLVAPSLAWADHTVLHTNASAMTAGEWRDITSSVSGLDAAFLNTTPGVEGRLNPYSNAIRWDPRTKRIYYHGQDHNGDRRLVRYTDSTNAWTIEGENQSGADVPYTLSLSGSPEHGFGSLALDAPNGYLIKQRFNGYNTPIQFYRMAISSQTWDQIATIPTTEILQCCSGIEFWPRVGLFHLNGGDDQVGGGASLWRLNVGWETGTYAASWTKVMTPAQLPAMGNKENFLIYCEQQNVMYGGGGTGNITTMFRLAPEVANTLSPDGAWVTVALTTVTSLPATYTVSTDEITCDPVSGNLLFLHSLSSSTSSFYKYVNATNTWTQLADPPAGVCSGGGLGCFTDSDFGAIDTYGVMVLVACPLTGCKMYLYKHTPVTVSQWSDFRTRCAQAGVLRCLSLDDQSQVTGIWGYQPRGSIAGSSTTPSVATDQAASGLGSVKFTIPTLSGADAGGSVFINVADDLTSTFTEGESVTIQWRQRFNTDFLSTIFTGGGGWKQTIFSKASLTGAPAGSCELVEIVTQNSNQVGLPQGYNACGVWRNWWVISENAVDYNRQPAILTQPTCHTGRVVSDAGWNPATNDPPSPCFRYYDNEWMTFKVRVDIGTFNSANSRIRLYAARDGQASVLLADMTSWTIDRAGSDTLGQLWLTPYHTNKSAAQSHPTGAIWYDEVIISTNDIADPGFASSSAGLPRMTGGVRISGGARVN